MTGIGIIHNKKKGFNKGRIKRGIRTYLLTCVGLLLLLSALSGCVPSREPVSKSAFFFNTYITITFYSEADAALFPECFSLCEKYEKLFSRTNPESELYKLNHSGGKTFTVSEETAEVITEALKYCEMTDGALDITIAPVMDLWNFSEAENGQLPPDEAVLSEALSHVDYTKVRVSGRNVTLEDPEAAIDLGFIAKGYIADRLKEFLESKGVTSALINLGGNIDLIGAKPDGSDYIIGVKKPFDETGEPITTVPLRDKSFVTSGIYERCFKTDDILYHHILDARTGYPVSNNLYSVSVLCEDSEKADALSTTLMILGMEKGMETIDSLDYAHALFVDDKYALFYSSGFPE